MITQIKSWCKRRSAFSFVICLALVGCNSEAADGDRSAPDSARILQSTISIQSIHDAISSHPSDEEMWRHFVESTQWVVGGFGAPLARYQTIVADLITHDKRKDTAINISIVSGPDSRIRSSSLDYLVENDLISLPNENGNKINQIHVINYGSGQLDSVRIWIPINGEFIIRIRVQGHIDAKSLESVIEKVALAISKQPDRVLGKSNLADVESAPLMTIVHDWGGIYSVAGTVNPGEPGVVSLLFKESQSGSVIQYNTIVGFRRQVVGWSIDQSESYPFYFEVSLPPNIIPDQTVCELVFAPTGIQILASDTLTNKP